MTVQKMIERIKWTMQNKSHNKEFCEGCIQALEELEQYRALGTVEELKEAMEKQIAKKPTFKGDFIGFYECKCGAIVEKTMSYCCECGKKLDWSEEDD